MTNYYTMEDEQSASTVTALDNWDSTVRGLEGIAPEIAERVNLAGGKLREVWDAAEARGDQQALALISESWAHIEEMATKAVMLGNGLHTAGEVIVTLTRELDRVDANFAELERAVEAVDTRHELVDQLVDDVREMVADEITQDVENYTIDSLFQDIYDNVTEITGVKDWMAINNFFHFLQFGGKRTQKQVDLLTELVSTFERKEGRR